MYSVEHSDSQKRSRRELFAQARTVALSGHAATRRQEHKNESAPDSS